MKFSTKAESDYALIPKTPHFLSKPSPPMVVPSFTKGSPVEVSSDDPGFHGAWYVAIFQDEVQLHQSKTKNRKKIGYRVSYVSIAEETNLSKRLTEIVDPSFVRPLPPRNNQLSEADYELFDVVDAYLLDGWWMGVVTKVINNGNKYMVSFEYPPEEVEFKRSKLRLHVDWVDGRWQVPPKKTLEQGSQESAITNAEHRDSLLLEQEISIKEACEAKVGKSRQKRKRGRPSKSLIEMPNGLLQDNQESGKTVSSTILEITTGVDEPLSTWYQGALKKTRGSRRSAFNHGDEPSDALDLAIVNNPEMTEYQQEWPFIKRSPIWATIESLELYQNPPQNPHFSLLKEAKEDHREGLAIGHMVTFANVVQITSELKLDDPNNDMIENSLETLVELETHGFDVGAVQARLNELVSRKGQVGELKDKVKQVEKDLQERNLEMSKIDEELGQLEEKMQDLKDQLAESAKKRKMKNEEIKMLQSNMHLFGNQIMDLEGYF